MRWLPWFGWRLLGADEALELDLPVRWQWRALEFAWLDFGLILVVEPIEP